MNIEGWERVDSVASASLASARLALHWASQAVAAAGASLAPPKEDASHTAFAWLREERAIAGAILPSGARAALRFEAFELFVANDSGMRIGPGLPLAGRTLDEAIAWLGENLGGTLTRPAHELPASPIAHGGRFEVGSIEARRELGRWFGDAAAALAPFAALEIASPIRVWPHHFDIATLLALGGDGERARKIGVGFSPGDESYAEPYFYATPWPAPKPLTEPAVRGGRWHTEGWFGAVLTASSLVASPDDQAATVASFLEEAVAAGRAMLGRGR